MPYIEEYSGIFISRNSIPVVWLAFSVSRFKSFRKQINQIEKNLSIGNLGNKDELWDLIVEDQYKIHDEGIGHNVEGCSF